MGSRNHVRADHQLAQRGERRHLFLDDQMEQRRGQQHGGNALADDRLLDPGQRGLGIGENGKPPAEQQRAPDLELAQVEAERREKQQRLVRAKVHVILVHHQPHYAAMGYHHAFRFPGGARRVHDIDRIVGPYRDIRRSIGKPVSFRAQRIVAEASVLQFRISFRILCARPEQRQAGAAIIENVALARGRIGGIERDVGRAGLDDGENHFHGCNRPVGQQRDMISATNSPRKQCAGEAIGVGFQLAIGARHTVRRKRHAICETASSAAEFGHERTVVGQRRPHRVAGIEPGTFL